MSSPILQTINRVNRLRWRHKSLIPPLILHMDNNSIPAAITAAYSLMYWMTGFKPEP
ncbi:MAG: hypothetical protein PHW04_15555 [Candidatus Wallbacteria bacterium]|nr:hypothetical protein [Candidatus Wallbacteria bacterium]